MILLGINILYFFFFALASLFPLRLRLRENGEYKRIIVLIPGYKEDSVIIDVAIDALKQEYPQDQYDVAVIADSFKESTITKLKELPIRLIEVSFENSTKAKALNRAMSVLPNDYDIAVVLDADNIMAPNFLSQVNSFFAAKLSCAVQGHRVAKNINTPFAVLDAISEEVNNRLFRKGHSVLKLSASIIGSGVAFDYPYFKNIMMQMKAVSGYDKELEIELLRNKHRVYYLPDALVYDEKIQNAEAFSKQRRRWLFSQFYYFRIAFFDALKRLFVSGNIDYFDKVFQWILLPRIIVIGMMGMLAPLFIILEWLIFHNAYMIPAWITLFCILIITFLVAIPGKFYNMQTLQAIRQIPKGLWLMFKNFFMLKGTNKTFIHTSHGTSEGDSKDTVVR
ncbi:MAG: glycosyltransferase family 2 protein [Bacteroidales bacterium]|nr:glycosyltransferase family 2 protein [Bacteroidales bacterium]